MLAASEPKYVFSPVWITTATAFHSLRWSPKSTSCPAAKRMISPGTNILSGISFSLPSRITVALLLTMAFSFSAALSARSS